ncbi:MAG: JmjC domain-containing protein [Phenylobacterium sp.]
MTGVQPRAFADPALARAGDRILGALFGGGEAYEALERGRRAMVRRQVGDMVSLSAGTLWNLVDGRALDVADHEFRLVRAGPAGLERIDVASYARARRLPDGRTVQAPCPETVRRLYGEGASLVFQQLDRKLAPLAGFCNALSARLGHPCQASAYLSPPGSQGLDVHHDTHDVIVLQLEGDKEFLLFEPVIDQPVPRIDLPQGTVDAAAPVARIVLRPGDLLYLPRGVPHCAHSRGAPSLHVTVGILALTWAGLFERLSGEMYFIEPLRRACRAGQVFDAHALNASAAEMVACLQTWLQVFGAERLAALACESFVSSFAPRPSTAERETELPACSVEPAPRGGVYVVNPKGRVAVSEAQAEAWVAPGRPTVAPGQLMSEAKNG